MSLSPMEEAFAKAGLVSREELEKKEQDRLEAQKKAEKEYKERLAKIKEERKNLPEGILSPTQIEAWRKVLFGMIGPYALLLPADEIQKFRDKMQKEANDLDEERKKEGKNTQHEKD